MREPKQTTQILQEILQRSLSFNELKVFILWASHSFDFNPSQGQIAKPLNISNSTVSRALKSLVNKDILKVAGYENGSLTMRSKVCYDLTDSFKQSIGE